MFQRVFTELRAAHVPVSLIVGLALAVLSCPQATAQPVTPPSTLIENHAAANAIIQRDNAAGVFVDVSTAESVIIAHSGSGIVCSGTPETLHLFFSISPNAYMVGCRITIDGEETGRFDVIVRAMTVSDESVRLLGQAVTQMLSESGQFYVETSADAIAGQPWNGATVEVGGGNNNFPVHPPYSISRFQGVRDGAPVYLRVAYANIGRWTFTQRIEAPMANQIAAEGLGSLQFYNMLVTAQSDRTAN